MVSEGLRKALLSKGIPEEALESIVELNFEDFRRAIETNMAVYQEQIDKSKGMYATVEDLRRDKIIKYYALPTGEIGYIVIDKKRMGFYKN